MLTVTQERFFFFFFLEFSHIKIQTIHQNKPLKMTLFLNQEAKLFLLMGGGEGEYFFYQTQHSENHNNTAYIDRAGLEDI